MPNCGNLLTDFVSKQAMECYFRDSDFEKPGNKRSNLMRPSKMVLKDDLWRGQEHGSNTETIPHSRYLRCLCESFGTGEHS